MRVTCFCVLLALAFLSSAPAHAAGSYNGTLQQVWAGDAALPNRGWLVLSGYMSAPACNPVYAHTLIFDLTDPIFKIHFAAALTALAAGKPVLVYGTGTCDGSYERLRAIVVSG